MTWNFYGRQAPLSQLREILERKRWFFLKVTGRRRIGKTTLIHQALRAKDLERSVYVQIPDSAPAGVLAAFQDSYGSLGIDPGRFPPPASFGALAATIAAMVRAGYVVVLDEFQYFHRERLHTFCSLLQAQVDELAREADRVPGGLIVLGSLHTELTSLLEERDAPLYGRITHEIRLPHLDLESVVEILEAHRIRTPERLLFLWGLFEGVPKFYRDAYEEGLLAADRRELLEGLFFRSSSPLASEAENWFLKELRGRYDVVLQHLARHPGATHAGIVEHVRQVSRDEQEQVAGYLKILIDRYELVARRQPLFGRANGKRGRYCLTDNFLTAWLAALKTPVASLNFRPARTLVEVADLRLATHEGWVLEKLVKHLYEERSRKQIGDFPLTEEVAGFWNRGDADVDLIFLDGEDRRIRFGTAKRDPSRLEESLPALERGMQAFLEAHPRFRDWSHEKLAVAPRLTGATRRRLRTVGVIPEDLADLTNAW